MGSAIYLKGSIMVEYHDDRGNRIDAAFAERVAASLRAPERAHPSFEKRVMDRVRVEGRSLYAAPAQSPDTTWWRTEWIIRLSPRGGVAIAAGNRADHRTLERDGGIEDLGSGARTPGNGAGHSGPRHRATRTLRLRRLGRVERRARGRLQRVDEGSDGAETVGSSRRLDRFGSTDHRAGTSTLSSSTARVGWRIRSAFGAPMISGPRAR